MRSRRAEAERRYARGDLTGTLRVLCSLLADQPDDAETWSDLAAVYFDLGANECSRKCCVSALALDPDYEPARQNLRLLCQAQGRNPRALVERASALGRDRSALRAAAVEVLFREGCFEGAARLADRWTEEAPNCGRAWNDAAVIAHRLGRHERAVACIREAARLAPDDPRVAGNRNLIDSGTPSGTRAGAKRA
ncbi:MAG: tetratricopeptide repeat protein [Candidatus Brocadiia bacterium]